MRSHLYELSTVVVGGYTGEPLQAVLKAYVLLAHQHHGSELATSLHQGEHLARGQQHINYFLRTLLSEGAAAGDVRTNVSS